jgi:hypothetical protein
MTDPELDGLYSELSQALTAVGESAASLLLARFALLAMGEIDDCSRIRSLIAQALASMTDIATSVHVQRPQNQPVASDQD